MSDRLLNDWIDSYLEFVDQDDPPESFKLWTAISCIAACLKRKVWLEWGTQELFPNMYVILVGPSGCRKGTAMKPGQKFLRELNIKMSSEATTRASLVRELFLASDSTPDAIEGTISLHSSLTVFSKEFAVFIGYDNKQLMSDLCDWYDCDSQWRNTTKTQGAEDIRGVWLNLIGGTTPHLIQSTLPLDAVGGGLTSRMIFVYESRRGKDVMFPFPSEKEAALYEPLLRDLEKILMLNGRFKFSKTFMDRYAIWFSEKYLHPPFSDNRFEGYNQRRAIHILKLAMILNASRSGQMFLEGIDMERADIILTSAEKKMPLTFAGVGKSQTAPVMPRIMLHLGESKRMLYAEIVALLSADADEFLIEKSVRSLEISGYLKVVNDGRNRWLEATEEGIRVFNPE